MPFGLCNATVTFQRTVDIVLSRFKWHIRLVYPDDVIVFSESLDDHLRHVKEVLTVFRVAGFSLKPAKCKFFTSRVDYLWRIILLGILEAAWKNM